MHRSIQPPPFSSFLCHASFVTQPAAVPSTLKEWLVGKVGPDNQELAEDDEVYSGLLACRATSLQSGFSPDELLMGRKLRTTVPIATNPLNCRLELFKDISAETPELKSSETRGYSLCLRKRVAAFATACLCLDWQRQWRNRRINLVLIVFDNFERLVVAAWRNRRHLTRVTDSASDSDQTNFTALSAVLRWHLQTSCNR